MMKRFENFMRRLGWMRVPRVGSGRPDLSKEQMLAAFAEPSLLYEVTQEVLAQAIDSAAIVAQRSATAMDHGLLAYYVGGQAHLEMFRDGLAARRIEALKAARGE